MPAGIIYAVYAAVFAVMRMAILMAQLAGQLLGLLVSLTWQYPKAMVIICAAAAVVAAGALYGPELYHSTRQEALSIVSGVGSGQGSNNELCRTARKTNTMATLLSRDRQAKYQEALDQQCWRLPTDQADAVCPADLFNAAARPTCIKHAELCYLNAMELIAGLRSSAMSARDCLAKIVMIRQIDLRRAKDASREESPDGDWVRLSQLDDAAVIAKVSAAFGGVSPMVRQEDRMRAGDPQYLRFQWATQFGTEQLDAAMAVSHARSHFVVAHRMEGLDRSDPRSTTALFVLGTDGIPKIVVPIGHAGFKYQKYVARFTSLGRNRDVPLEAIPGTDNIFSIADAPFDHLLIFGDQPSDATKLYELNSTPRLTDRAKFFKAVAEVIGR